MSRSASPFHPATVLSLLAFGAAVFLAMLYLIGAGETGRGTNDGGAHGAAKGLTGYAALVEILRDNGHQVNLSRSEAAFDDATLLVLTPDHLSDGEELASLIEERRYSGPTLVILPKWLAVEIPDNVPVEAEDGWVVLSGAHPPGWTDALTDDLAIQPEVAKAQGGFSGLGYTGRLPDPEQVQSAREDRLVPLVRGEDGSTLIGWIDDDGYYPMLAEASDYPAGNEDRRDTDKWNVIFVVEPDLMNNYGMADETRAELARAVIDLAMEGEDLPVTFDLTLVGLGRTPNLLTLAFAPPFLAATLCLILALIVVAWRAFLRFGPSAAEARAIEFGKKTLVANGARLIRRTGRFHLLGAPFAALSARRIAKQLGLKPSEEERIDRHVSRRLPDGPSFAATMHSARNARRPEDIMRAAAALDEIERKLER